MKNVDEQIREIFSQKLGNLETDVSPELWNAVQSQMPGATGALVGGSVKVIAIKWIAALAVVAVVVSSAIYVLRNSETTEQLIAVPPTVKSEVLAPVSDEKAAVVSSTDVENRTEGEGVTVQKPTVENQLSAQKVSNDLESDKSATQSSQVTIKSSTPTTNTQERPLTEKADSMSSDFQNSTLAITTYHQELKGSFTVLPMDLEEMRYSFTSSDDDAKYQWSFGDGTFSEGKWASHTYENEGEFGVALTVTNRDGATKNSMHTLNVFKPGKLLIPNIFTPNGDGSNDTFDISSGSKGMRFRNIEIRNSRGITVFQSDGSVMWEGLENHGNVCPSGTYQYFISAIDRNQEIHKKMGNVVLIR